MRCAGSCVRKSSGLGPLNAVWPGANPKGGKGMTGSAAGAAAPAAAFDNMWPGDAQGWRTHDQQAVAGRGFDALLSNTAGLAWGALRWRCTPGACTQAPCWPSPSSKGHPRPLSQQHQQQSRSSDVDPGWHVFVGAMGSTGGAGVVPWAELALCHWRSWLVPCAELASCHWRSWLVPWAELALALCQQAALGSIFKCGSSSTPRFSLQQPPDSARQCRALGPMLLPTPRLCQPFARCPCGAATHARTQPSHSCVAGCAGGQPAAW